MNKIDHASAIVAGFTGWLGEITDLRTTSRTWMSATFAGTRYSLSFVAQQSGVERFLAEVGEAELPLRGAFVADVDVVRRESIDAGVALTVDVLVIDEA